MIRSSHSGDVWCYGCDKWVPREEFYKNAARGNGLDSMCKPCSRLRVIRNATGTLSKREKNNRDQRGYKRNARKKVLLHYSRGTMKCAKCGFSDERALTIDHLNGGGEQHRAKVGGGNSFVQWLISNKYPEGYQILCANCQFIKRAEEGQTGGRKSWTTRNPKAVKHPTPEPTSDDQEGV